MNPKHDEAEVLLKREEIKTQLEVRQADIVSGEVIVLIEYECHLLWGDTLGYVAYKGRFFHVSPSDKGNEPSFTGIESAGQGSGRP